MKNIKKAFSLAELMIVMLVLTIILAATMPILSKRAKVKHAELASAGSAPLVCVKTITNYFDTTLTDDIKSLSYTLRGGGGGAGSGSGNGGGGGGSSAILYDNTLKGFAPGGSGGMNYGNNGQDGGLVSGGIFNLETGKKLTIYVGGGGGNGGNGYQSGGAGGGAGYMGGGGGAYSPATAATGGTDSGGVGGTSTQSATKPVYNGISGSLTKGGDGGRYTSGSYTYYATGGNGNSPGACQGCGGNTGMSCGGGAYGGDGGNNGSAGGTSGSGTGTGKGAGMYSASTSGSALIFYTTDSSCFLF